VCYIAGPEWRDDVGLIIGCGPVGHPWGPGETGEVTISPVINFAVADVEVSKRFDPASVALRKWRVTKSLKRARRSDKQHWLEKG